MPIHAAVGNVAESFCAVLDFTNIPLLVSS